MPINGILFDFGYTLADYQLPESDDGSWRAMLAECLAEVEQELSRLRLPAKREALAEVAEHTLYRPSGLGHREVPLDERLLQALDAVQVSVDPGNISRLMKAFYAPVNRSCYAYPDSEPALRALRERGIKIGLVSNSPWGAPGDFGRLDVARAGLMDYFDALVFSGDSLYRKPAPEIFQEALDALNLSPAEVVFVGDDPLRDIAGAKGAGMRTVHRPYRMHAKMDIEPDWVISDCFGILQVLEEMDGRE